MPEGQLCWHCKKTVDLKTDKYVIVSEAKGNSPDRR